jgi:hypothetical protein
MGLPAPLVAYAYQHRWDHFQPNSGDTFIPDGFGKEHAIINAIVSLMYRAQVPSHLIPNWPPPVNMPDICISDVINKLLLELCPATHGIYSEEQKEKLAIINHGQALLAQLTSVAESYKTQIQQSEKDMLELDTKCKLLKSYNDVMCLNITTLEEEKSALQTKVDTLKFEKRKLEEKRYKYEKDIRNKDTNDSRYCTATEYNRHSYQTLSAVSNESNSTSDRVTPVYDSSKKRKRSQDEKYFHPITGLPCDQDERHLLINKPCRTILCRFNTKDGVTCHNGDYCLYAHDKRSLNNLAHIRCHRINCSKDCVYGHGPLQFIDEIFKHKKNSKI